MAGTLAGTASSGPPRVKTRLPPQQPPPPRAQVRTRAAAEVGLGGRTAWAKPQQKGRSNDGRDPFARVGFRRALKKRHLISIRYTLSIKPRSVTFTSKD